jgi:molybdopterin-containing oxidoreductase family membrane subunit
VKQKTYNILLIVGMAGLALGLIGLANRLLYGHVGMAYGSYVPWGLWIAFDLLFLGLTSGAYLVILLIYAFGQKQFERLAPLAVFCLLVTLMCQGIIISLDLGHPFRVFWFFLTPSFTSMMFWLVASIFAMWILFIPFLYIVMRERLFAWSQDPRRRGHKIYQALLLGRTEYSDADRQNDQKKLRVLAYVAIPIGLIFFAMPSAMFTDMLGRPSWDSALVPILYMGASYVSGCALITLLAAVFMPREDGFHVLRTMIISFLIIFLFMEFIQFFVGFRTANPAAVAVLTKITSGSTWWIFWGVHLFLGALIPLLLLSLRAHDPRSIAWACFLIIVGILAVRYNAVVPELMAYNIENRHLFFVHPRLSQNYAPNIYELLVALWVSSFWLVAFLVGIRWLPVAPAKKGEA